MKKVLLFAAACMMLFGACKQKVEAPVEQDTDNIYQFSVLGGTGDTVDLSVYQGKVLLVVNTATQCGFTPQYEELQRLYDLYRDQGFEILDFPCNQFGQQAPGTNEEIHEFCTGNYNITFPQMAKIDVNGADEEQSPLYAWLIAKAPFAGFDTTNPIGARLDQMFRSQDSLFDRTPDIKWNFTKFLIDREGSIKARFEPTADMKLVREKIAELI